MIRSNQGWGLPGYAVTGTAAWADGAMKFVPLFLPSGTYDRLGVEVTVVGTAGALYRMGIYADTGDVFPGALVVDGGTVDVTPSTGVKQVTINTTIAAGLYWLAAVSQGGAATPATVRYASPLSDGSIGNVTISAFTFPLRGLSLAGVTGALPGTGATAVNEGTPTITAIRRSA